MLPEINYRHLKNIKFPVYPLPSEDVEYRDGLVLLENKVIDDTNMPGDTLGKRRLKTPHLKYKLIRAYQDIASIIHSGKTKFIDYNGQTFKYNKTKFVSLKYHKIKKVERKELVSILWVVGVDTPFSIPRPPPVGSTYVGILYYDKFPWLLYEYSERKLPNTKKKI